jgi:hypothetical protein
LLSLSIGRAAALLFVVVSGLTLFFALLPTVNVAHGAPDVLGVVCARSSTTFVLRHGAEL